MVDACGDFFASHKSFIVLSVFYWILCALWSIFYIGGAIQVMSIGNYVHDDTDTITHQTMKLQEDSQEGANIAYITFFMFFNFLWILFWIKECNIFVIMYAVSTYYFDSDAKREGRGDLNKGFSLAHK